MKIIYKGEPNSKLDKVLETILDLFKYEFIGSGYDCTTDERDLCFEKKYRDIKCVKKSK